MANDLVDTMKAWEKTGAIGAGPPETLAAAKGPAAWKQALGRRYGLNPPVFEPPPQVPGIADGPEPHDALLSSGQRLWQNYLQQHPVHIGDGGWHRPNPMSEDWLDRIDAIGEAILAAKAAGKRIRPVASGHSASIVCKPDEGHHLIQVEDFKRVMVPKFLKAGVDPTGLAWIEAGTRIVDVNRQLADTGRGLPIMGGYNGQTVIGALCTGTHGSGINHPPLYAAIQSMQIVTLGADGKPQLRVVERTDGITDRAAFEAATGGPARRRFLIQDTAVFDTVAMGMGWLGVVYSLTISVRPGFWLKQTRSLTTLKNAFSNLKKDVKKVQHFEWVVNPQPCWQADGTFDHSTMRVWRKEVPPPADGVALWPRNRTTAMLDDLVKNHPNGAAGIKAAFTLAGKLGDLGPTLHNILNGDQLDGFVTSAPRTFILPAGNHFRAKSCEIMLPYSKAERGVRAVLGVVRDHAAKNQFFDSPMGVRFIRATPGTLSPYDRDDGENTVSMEVPVLITPSGGSWASPDQNAMLDAVIAAAAPLGGRPHWGQYNGMTRELMLGFYGPARVARFEQVFRDYNRFGLFSNPLSDKLFGVPAGGLTV
jgi:hypothetical protein